MLRFPTRTRRFDRYAAAPRRRPFTGLGGITIAVVLVIGLTACTGTAANQGNGDAGPAGVTTISLMTAGLNKLIYLPVLLAQRLNLFGQQHLDVRLSEQAADVDVETALLAGQVEAAVGFYDHTIDLQSKGKFTESVIQFSQVPGEVVLCRRDLAGQIRSPADWRGRAIGVTGIGASTSFLTAYLATRYGLLPEDITPVAVGAGDTFIAAMRHRQIDCGMTTEPTVTALLKSGMATVLVDLRDTAGTRAALGGLFPAACVYVRTDVAASHRGAIQKLVNALRQALVYISNHSATEITNLLPASVWRGIGQPAYIDALAAGKAMFTTDGVMPAEGPATVLRVLTAFDQTVRDHPVDLSRTYTSQFVAAQPVQPTPTR